MGKPVHSILSKNFIADNDRTDWHDETLFMVRKKRDYASNQIPEWETLRQWASQIKAHTLSNLDHYLTVFEKNANANGIQVHWAANAMEHNEIIYGIIKQTGISSMVKSKSMLTEECHLNEYLQDKGIQVTDTDLGEWIIQLRKEHPSHIVLPAIHLKKKEVSDTFHQHIQTEKNNNDPKYLTTAARHHLRNIFIKSKLAITGVNFAISETGGIVICTNEGNADMGVHGAAVHIACMGIEKIIPGASHLSVFLRLLARSATGQAITTYSSHFTSPRKGQQMHIVIVDNGRTRLLGNNNFRNSLKCIRCAACFNTCPVYRKTGGHSYHSTVAGPIGSILNPNTDIKANADLPFACTLCGSCSNVCPVKIDIHNQLWIWRQQISKEGYAGKTKSLSMKMMAYILSHPNVYRFSGNVFRMTLKYFPFIVKNKLNPWYRQREMPEAPKKSFRQWYIQKQKSEFKKQHIKKDN